VRLPGAYRQEPARQREGVPKYPQRRIAANELEPAGRGDRRWKNDGPCAQEIEERVIEMVEPALIAAALRPEAEDLAQGSYAAR
jgi:hypothetical protein